MPLRGLFNVPGRGAGVAVRGGGYARLVAAWATACGGTLGAAPTNAGGRGILELLAHAIELRRVIRAEPATGQSRRLAMTSTTTAHTSFMVANANARSGPEPSRAPLRGHLVEHRVAGQVDGRAVADHRVEGSIGKKEHPPSCARVEADRGPRTQIGEVDDVPYYGGRAGDPASGSMAPTNPAGAGVERIEVTVVGALVHGGSDARDVRNGGGGIDVIARPGGPAELACPRRERVHPPIGVAHVHPPVCHRGGGIEVATAEAELGPAGVRGPDPMAGAGIEGVSPPRVVAEVQAPVRERGATFDRAARVERPVDVAVSGIQRVHLPLLVA